MSQESVQKLRIWIREQGIDAFLVFQPQNRTYLSGWAEDDPDAGLLLVGTEQLFLLTSTLYEEVVTREAPDCQVIVITPSYEYAETHAVQVAREYAHALVPLAQKHNWKTVGFESSAVSYAAYEEYQQVVADVFTLKPFADSYVEQLRLVKHSEEIALLRRAIAITDETFASICAWIMPGMTEKEIAWEISRKMVELGADGTAFATIVASGPHGSMPHSVPSDRRIQRGELITIDMGARYKGYCADMTRTICLGEPAEPRMREVYDTVLRAMKTCEQKMHAGMSGREADALARDVLVEANLADYYIHITGHGVGLQIHENPRLSPRVPDYVSLPVGCVVTVEPGVYIPGWTGTRVEDCVLVKEHGVEVLTQSPTELVIQR
jgi:Xaa-Pro aminopeptidase